MSKVMAILGAASGGTPTGFTLIYSKTDSTSTTCSISGTQEDDLLLVVGYGGSMSKLAYDRFAVTRVDGEKSYQHLCYLYDSGSAYASANFTAVISEGGRQVGIQAANACYWRVFRVDVT